MAAGSRWFLLLPLVAGCAVPPSRPPAKPHGGNLSPAVKQDQDWEAVADDRRRRLEMDPHDAAACAELGFALRQLRQFYAARQQYERSVALMPQNAGVRLQYAELLEATGESKLA